MNMMSLLILLNHYDHFQYIIRPPSPMFRLFYILLIELGNYTMHWVALQLKLRTFTRSHYTSSSLKLRCLHFNNYHSNWLNNRQSLSNWQSPDNCSRETTSSRVVKHFYHSNFILQIVETSRTIKSENCNIFNSAICPIVSCWTREDR